MPVKLDKSTAMGDPAGYFAPEALRMLCICATVLFLHSPLNTRSANEMIFVIDAEKFEVVFLLIDSLLRLPIIANVILSHFYKSKYFLKSIKCKIFHGQEIK